MRVVGAGVLGTMHAWHAIKRGHRVVHIEREAEARGASVRSFGLVRVGGRAEGEELAVAQRARQLWGEFLAALHCARDGAVEPRTAQLALRAVLRASGRYDFLPGREVRELVGARAVRDDHGEVHCGDAVVLCTGAHLGGLVRELVPDLPVRRVRLQMMQTDPLGEQLTTSVADGDSFRYYPGYGGPALDALDLGQPQHPTAARHRMQLLMVQRRDGGLTIGDTHAYDQPFGFDVVEDSYAYLTGLVESVLGRALPPIRRRWAGVYAQCADTARVVHRQQVRDGVWLVTGPGGRGMTCSPAIAETTADLLGL
ncbi:FAD-dependent oxidoreductase [Kitasatospora sp. NPDC002965]|uniref:FAD-dependent oxidoreductase n=1 Tax=Kitasatospora sp. NPDC002965 TaxID=3154775 RepID=UPI0033A22825